MCLRPNSHSSATETTTIGKNRVDILIIIRIHFAQLQFSNN